MTRRLVKRLERVKETKNKIQMIEPIGLNALSEFIETILNSSRVKGNRDPLSAIIERQKLLRLLGRLSKNLFLKSFSSPVDHIF